MTGPELTAEMQKIAERIAKTLDEIPAAFDAKRKRREKLEERIAVGLRSTYSFAELQGCELGIMIGARDAAVRARTGAGEKIAEASRRTWGARLLSRLGLVRIRTVREAVASVPVPPTLPVQAVEMARRLREAAKKASK
jgi:hypothetical protein